MAFYATLSWLPSILEDDGRSPETAGALLALSSLVQLAAGLLRPGCSPPARRNQTWLLAWRSCWSRPPASPALLAAPGAAPLWIALIGIGPGRRRSGLG